MDHQWDTDTVRVHHPLMDTDIVMDHLWVMGIVMPHHIVMDIVTVPDREQTVNR